ncbi:MAG TPA: TRAP transporter substrate-binding protein [Longimicrobiaceae bacterium]|nr:TRAP transporter substrate-binding protein [Longimicrobiaceae bacterium]
MERREFARKAVLGLAAGGLAGCGGGGGAEGGGPAVQTGRRVMWRMVSSFPRGLDTIYGASETLSKRVSALTDGRFQVRAYPAGELVPGLQVLDAVQQGTVQAGHSASYYYTGKNPALAFDCAVPFGLTVRGHNAWLLHGGGLERMRELFSDFNVVNFPGGNTGAQMGGWFRRPIGSLAELRGLKMRIPGLGGEVMNRLGVSVQVLSGGDIYPALERGAIDATEWVGPYDDEKLGFHKVVKNYHYPGWWEPGPALSFYVNKTAWEQLPANYREAFEVASREASLDMMARYDAQNPPALARLVEQGVRLVPFPQDVMQAALGQSAALFEEQAGRDAAYRRIYDEWKKVRGETYRWFGVSDQAYEQFAFPRLAAR